jgi:hypothetical protein
MPQTLHRVTARLVVQYDTHAGSRSSAGVLRRALHWSPGNGDWMVASSLLGLNNSCLLAAVGGERWSIEEVALLSGSAHAHSLVESVGAPAGGVAWT